MRKLMLDMEMLAVESFAPAEAVVPRGTVAGHAGDTDLDLLTCAGFCPPDCEHDAVFVLTYDGRETCTYSCPGKCFNTNMLETQCC